MPRSFAALLLLAAACCSNRPAPGPPATPEPEIPESVDAMPAQTPPTTSDFVPGPALTPSGPLLAWIEEQGEKTLRLPVVITFGNPGRFSIGSAYIGTTAGPAPADAILLKLDGTALSISLVDQVRQRCSDKSQMTCVLWLDGRWGALVPALPTSGGGGGDRHPFAVLKVGDVVDPADAATAFVTP